MLTEGVSVSSVSPALLDCCDLFARYNLANIPRHSASFNLSRCRYVPHSNSQSPKCTAVFVTLRHQ